MIAWLTLVAPASAVSDLEFKTNGPVLIYVDDQQAALQKNLRQRASDLPPGKHTIRVAGVFGKTLYEAEMELPDGTLTVAEWSGRELAVLSTAWREETAAEAPVDGLEEPLAAPAPLPDPVPEEVAAPEAEPVAPVEPAEEAVPAAVLPPPPPSPPPRTLRVAATEGTRVEVVHGDEVVVIVIENGTTRIEDGSGLAIELGRVGDLR